MAVVGILGAFTVSVVVAYCVWVALARLIPVELHFMVGPEWFTAAVIELVLVRKERFPREVHLDLHFAKKNKVSVIGSRVDNLHRGDKATKPHLHHLATRTNWRPLCPEHCGGDTADAIQCLIRE